MNSFGEFMRDFVSMGVAGAHGKTSTTGMLSHVLSNITDTSYLIGDGQVVVSAAANHFVFESDEYERHFMPTILNTASLPILTSTIQTISRAWKMSLMPLTIMLNKSAKDSSSMEKTKELRRITSSAPIYYYGFDKRDERFCSKQPASFNDWFNPSTFISVEKT